VVTYRILKDYTDNVYQLSLASCKGGWYVERIQKRQDLKHKVLYCWQEYIMFVTLTREKIEKSMRDAVQCITRITPAVRGRKKQPSFFCRMQRKTSTRAIRHWETWTFTRMSKCWQMCNVILCFYRIVNLCCICSRKWQS